MTGPRLRQAVRALLLDDDHNVLLVRFNWQGLDLPEGFWACPGGGVETGEPSELALRRELAEELRMEDADIRGPVWRLTRMFPMSGWDGQTDITYLVRTPHFRPDPRVDLLAENVHGIRWFSLSEVTAGVVVFSPRDLPDLLSRVLTEGVPNFPHEVPVVD